MVIQHAFKSAHPPCMVCCTLQMESGIVALCGATGLFQWNTFVAIYSVGYMEDNILGLRLITTSLDEHAYIRSSITST